MTTALLIIDVQQALCSGEYEAFESQRVIDRINLVSRKARAVSAPVIIVQHESEGGPLDYGAEGWELAKGLEALPTDTYIRKKATDSFHQTELHSVLQARGIKRLVICGLQSEFCVDTTTRRALEKSWLAGSTRGPRCASSRNGALHIDPNWTQIGVE